MDARALHQEWPADWLEEQAQARRHVWAILDASADDAATCARRLDASPDCFNLLDHLTPDAAALAVAPRAVRMGRMGDESGWSVLQAAWRAQPTDEPVLFFIASSWAPAAWLQAMRRRARARFPDGERMLFRWWDARIWWALHEPALHAQADVQAFLAVEAASAWPGRSGLLQLSERLAPDLDPIEPEPAWSISDPTFAGLLESGHADAVLGICRSDYPGALDLVPAAQRHALAQTQAKWAQGQGFGSADDHALAVRIAAEVGPEWAEQPEWADVVSQAVACGQTLKSTLAQA